MSRIFTLTGMCLFWLLRNSQVNGSQKHKGFKLLKSDYLFDDYVQYLQDVLERLECAMVCVNTPDCPSFAYHQEYKECFIYDKLILTDEDSKNNNKTVSTFILKNSNEITIEDVGVQSTTNNSNKASLAVDRDDRTRSLTLEQDNPWWCTTLKKTGLIRMIIIDTDSSLVPQFDVRLSLDNECSVSGLNSSSFCNTINTSNINGTNHYRFTLKECTGIEMEAWSVYLTTNNTEPTSLAFYSVSVYPKLC